VYHPVPAAHCRYPHWRSKNQQLFSKISFAPLLALITGVCKETHNHSNSIVHKSGFIPPAHSSIDHWCPTVVPEHQRTKLNAILMSTWNFINYFEPTKFA
jgi:hypothetical protein